MRKIVRRKFAGGLSVQLRSLEKRAIAARKKLTRVSQRRKAKEWGKMNDALRMIEVIEQLARFGQCCSAADAVQIVGYVEVLTSKLASEIDCI